MAAKLFFALYPTPDAARRFHAFGLQLRTLHGLRAWPVAADRACM